MSTSFGSNFNITGSSQFTEEGFSRIPKKGQHHFHMTVDMTTPSTNTATLREYAAAGVLDLQQMGPQRIKAFKIHAGEQFWDDISSIDLSETERATVSSILAALYFTTSLGTTLSALDKTVSPVNIDYTTAQYRLMNYTGSSFSESYMDALAQDATGIAGAGKGNRLPSFNDFRWFGKWVDMRTDPLIVGPQLVVLFQTTMRRGNPMQFDTSQLSQWVIDIDIITEDEPMSAEDIWFTRRLFNQDATNRTMYFRFAQNA